MKYRSLHLLVILSEAKDLHFAGAPTTPQVSNQIVLQNIQPP